MRKTMLLVSVPLGVVTCTLPVVAPEGTVVVISELETTVNVAGVPSRTFREIPGLSILKPLRLGTAVSSRTCAAAMYIEPKSSVSPDRILRWSCRDPPDVESMSRAACPSRKQDLRMVGP